MLQQHEILGSLQVHSPSLGQKLAFSSWSCPFAEKPSTFSRYTTTACNSARRKPESHQNRQFSINGVAQGTGGFVLRHSLISIQSTHVLMSSPAAPFLTSNYLTVGTEIFSTWIQCHRTRTHTYCFSTGFRPGILYVCKASNGNEFFQFSTVTD